MDRQLSRDETRGLRGLADRLLSDLLADPLLGSVVAEPIIQQAIENGDLIPRERLMLAQGFELAPLGRLTDLEDAAISALDALSGDNPDIKAAIDLLLSVVSLPAGGEGDEEAGDAVGDEVASDPDSGTESEQLDPEPEVEPGPEPDVEPDVLTVKVPVAQVGRQEVTGDQGSAPPPRISAPDENNPGPCTQCGSEVPYPEALRSWTRFRRVLCESDFRSYRPEAVSA